jgi:hypothetical protein
MNRLIKVIILITIFNSCLFAQDSKKPYIFTVPPGEKFNTSDQGLFSLTEAPKITLKNLIVNQISMLLNLENNFEYRENLLRDLYEIDYDKNKVTITIYNSNSDKNRKINSISKLTFNYNSDEKSGFLSMEENPRGINFENIIPVTQNMSSGLMYSNRIVIDREIMNLGSSLNFGKILNRTVTKNRSHTPSGAPSTIFGDVTDAVILPHYTTAWNGQVMVTDAMWNRITSYDKELIQNYFSEIGARGRNCNADWAFNYPTGIDYGQYTETNEGCFTYKNYPVYICDKTCGKIVKFTYKMGYCPGPPQQWHLANPQNWTVVKSNLSQPYDIATHQASSSTTSDDVIWYSEFEKGMVCLNANTGQELQRFNTLYYNGAQFTIKPTRFSIYRSPDGTRNVMIVIDVETNTAFYLKLNPNGQFTSTSAIAAFSAFGYVSNKVESVLITSNNNGDGATVWGVANDEAGNGLITTSTLKFLTNSYPIAEHLGYSSIGRNSDAGFKKLGNLHAQNGFLDLFTMEKWDDNYGIRRYKPGIDVQGISASNYCVDYRYMTYKVTLTNPAHVQLSGEWKNVTAANWSNCFVSVDGVTECTNFYLPAGTSTLIIRTNQFNNMSTSSGENLLRINCTYSPQDEDFNSSNKLVRGYQVDVNNHCGGVNGGCPYLFTYNGNEFIAENNLLHKSELSENIGVNITDKYLLKVKPVLNEDKKFEFKIREAEDDHNIYDYVSLVAVDHPVGSRVGITEENDIVLYYDNSAYSPTNAEKNLSIDITKDVQYDTNDHKTVDGDPGDGIFGVFGDIEEDKTNLIKGRGIQQKYAVLMEVDALIRPINPGVKDYAGFMTGYNNADAVIFPTQPFAERENPYINIIPFSDNIWVDSATVDWNRDYSLNYLASLPIYYGGYETSECELYLAEDSLSGDIKGKLYSDDENTFEFDNNSHLTLNFNESTTLLQPGYTRSYVFVIKGQYYQNAQNRNSQINVNASKVVDLLQNYPNPFNPKTTIKFMLNIGSRVKIEIYDVLGKRISVLVDDFLQTGIHDVTFDGNNFASGVYFYKMTTDNFTSIKKMTLIK